MKGAEYYIDPNQSLNTLISRRPNVDVQQDLQKIKWSHFVGEENYESVGAYEGGFYLTEGVWRPEETSIMLSSEVPYFNAPSREAIVKRIFEIKDIPYSFEEFKKNDVIPSTTKARLLRLDNAKVFRCW